jgi:hypothetical protein
MVSILEVGGGALHVHCASWGISRRISCLFLFLCILHRYKESFSKMDAAPFYLFSALLLLERAKNLAKRY